MSRSQKLAVVLMGALITFMTSCAALQNVIVPAYVDPNAISYADVKVPEFGWWTTLWDLDKVDRGVEYQHYFTNLELQRSIEDDTFTYNWLKNSINNSRTNALELRDNLFSPTGPLSILLSTIPGLGIGWLALSKPSDKKKIETLKNGGSHATKESNS